MKMDLQHRLIMAFLIITIIPCMMIAAIGSIILGNQVRALEKTYNIDIDSWQIITEPVQVLNLMTKTTYNELCTTAGMHPEKMEDENVLNSFNDILEEKYSFLLVRKGEEDIFIGSEALYNDIKEKLPQKTNQDESYNGGIYLGGTKAVLIKVRQFTFEDGKEGSFYIITNVHEMILKLKSEATKAVLFGVSAIVATAFALVAWLYTGIIKPMAVLKTATKHIREGDLDYKVIPISEDEFGDLCIEFDEMRLHLKEETEARLKYEEDLKELISNISHDLKTPLTAIKGYSEGILDGVASTPEKKDKYLRTIIAKANDMTNLVEELACYAKIDTNNMAYHMEMIDVGDFFADCIDEKKEELELRGFELNYYPDIAPGTKALADCEQIKRVINNLFDNAVKYKSPDRRGHIDVRTKEDKEYVKIEIEDNGRGISKEALPHIFERFYRADTSRNTKQGGTGLGLAIANKIIEEHGGTIWAISEENLGTCIGFTLKKQEQEPKESITLEL